MEMIDLIVKKRDRKRLTESEISFFVNGYYTGKISDYQMTAMLMAIYLNGFNKAETLSYTKAIIETGSIIDNSKIKGPLVDKHSTGGVGDKVSLVLAPLAASLGLKVAKLSGKGLGHTGGTIDKLHSIKGVNTNISNSKLINQVNKIGLAIGEQTTTLAPADKKIYALRDVTGTVGSIPLIAASIMSKKIAANTNSILIDVKYGKGAFMKDLPSAKKLSKTMIDIGKHFNKKVSVMITDMSAPLGYTIGNSIEVLEAYQILNNELENDTYELSVQACARLLVMSGSVKSYESAYKKAARKIADKSALSKFKEMIKAQGGPTIDDKFMMENAKAKYSKNIVATKSGYIKEIDPYKLGLISISLGAGRVKIEDQIDYKAGIILKAKVGDKIKKGDVIATLQSSKAIKKNNITDALKSYSFSKEKPKPVKLVKSILN